MKDKKKRKNKRLATSVQENLKVEKYSGKNISNQTMPSIDDIYEKYGNALYTYIRHQVSDQNMAHDLFQDVMLKVLKNLKNFHPPGSLKAWLTVIARNHLRDHWRKKMRWRKLMLGSGDERDLSGNSEETNVLPFSNPQLKLENHEIGILLRQAVLQLPAAQQEVIDMHYHMDLSLREISQILGCSINTVASRLRYAIKKIRKIIEEYQ